MEIENEKPNSKRDSSWAHLVAPGRIDAFNFATHRAEISSLVAEYSCVAYDVTELQFMCLPMIKLLHTLALDVGQRAGRFALIGSSEKLKKQLRIYASLDPFICVNQEGWKTLTQSVHVQYS